MNNYSDMDGGAKFTRISATAQGPCDELVSKNFAITNHLI